MWHNSQEQIVPVTEYTYEKVISDISQNTFWSILREEKIKTMPLVIRQRCVNK